MKNITLNLNNEFFHISLYISNNEIYFYLQCNNEDFVNNLLLNNIDNFKKHCKLTYNQLFLLFKKIIKLIN
jgi:hypothetical protein